MSSNPENGGSGRETHPILRTRRSMIQRNRMPYIGKNTLIYRGHYNLKKGLNYATLSPVPGQRQGLGMMGNSIYEA
jgi:hypothetical protein